MKRLLIIVFMVCAFASGADAQTYLEHLQQQAPGSSLGTVKVEEDKEIDRLVNGGLTHRSPTPSPSPMGRGVDTPQGQKTQQEQGQKTQAKKQKEEPEKRTVKETEEEQQEENYDVQEPVVPDMSKKVLKNAIKVNGWRVQVYSGGNSRNDKQRATQIGHQIKYAFPDQPVYVHFKSPHWICRMGNYRTQQEAQAFLQQVKTMGFAQAILVKGKITVSR